MPYKDIKDMTSDELLEFKAYIDSESAKVKDQLMVAKSTGAATGQYLPIPEYANLLSKKSYYAKKSQQIQTLMGRKKKLEKQERGIVGAELVIANLKAENARLRQNVDTVEQQSARIAELEAQLAAAQADAGFWGRATARATQKARRLTEVLDEARELLLQAHEPDQGQLRTQWDKDVDEWIKKAAQAKEGE